MGYDSHEAIRLGAGQRHLLSDCMVVVETREAPRSRPSDTDGDNP